jgi:hypothetical protein
MGGRRVLVEGLTITEVVVVLHGDRVPEHVNLLCPCRGLCIVQPPMR